MSRLKLIELYRSLQGESTWSGRPCIFVRTAGCNLRCTWCDSEYTFTGGDWWSVDDILAEVARLGPGLVEVTGGEPLLQPEVNELMQRLLDAGRTVLLETSGSLPIDDVPAAVHKIVDFKAPGSGEMEQNRWEVLEKLLPHDEIKFVLADRADYEWTRGIMDERQLPARCRVLLSPVHGVLDPAMLSEWMLADGLDATLNLQLHRVIWPNADRGV